LNYKDSIQNIAILFESFAIRFEKKFKLRQISCLFTDTKWNARIIIETLLLWVQFNAKIAPY